MANSAAVNTGPSWHCLRDSCRGKMTHTTGLGAGSAVSRHRVVIGGAEYQERDSGLREDLRA
ncbi:hypothetical protein N7466_010034 [Penicillium verhagenii]|uniref:uncharacterized protein n=1 Tax=Penicillium verhagenii TaxID=1562060 RepID=UPI0025454704|nr:uncharacterized protein N7466_010034 [Penicillium verhagenii]KAJ5919091.1 hypothetical protein N7466_010034 [Penicillium verhagenii]